MEKKVVVKPGTWLGRVNLDNLEEAKSIFIIETKKCLYKANTLDGVFRLWKSSNDLSKVLDMCRVG